MDQSELNAIHNALIGFTKRAEKASDESLVAAFVDSAPLFTLLSTANNQVIYGRRGTGKTHALKYLAEYVERNSGEISVFLDMRTVGSNGSIYSDQSRPLIERASVLLSDALSGLLNEFYSISLAALEKGHHNPEELTRALDAFQSSINTVIISGDTSKEETSTSSKSSASSTNIGMSLSENPSAKIATKLSSGNRSIDQTVIKQSGKEEIHLSFGTISSAISNLISILGGRRVWFLIDEWSEIPVDLQPYLADLFRRALLPVNEITVKIAAIEHRTNFAILKEKGQYVGLELGADIGADLNLDDFLVFDNDQERAVDFIGNLIFRHYKTSTVEKPEFGEANNLIAALFTQRPVFEEFVRAVEGVPRDALNLIAKVVTKAYGKPIAMNHVRSGAADWYNQDKAAVIRNDPILGDLLQYIINEVIGERKARAFLLSSKLRHPEIDKLFDSRLLHVLKKNVSSHDTPGSRYDVYKIDYGCYVDLINTTSAPVGLLPEEDGVYIDVPKDDYRSIRRAILDPSMFVEKLQNSVDA